MKAVRVFVPTLWLHVVLGVRVDFSDQSMVDSVQEQKSNISICAAVSQETLDTHRRCLASLQVPSVLQRFPSLGKEWCDLRLMDITEHHCQSEEKDRLQGAAMLETSFRRITALIGSSEEALTAEGAWESCSSRHGSCVECESRYAGAREHIATAHACEWRAGACVKSSRQRPRPWGEAASACGRDPAGGSLLETGGWARGNRTGARADSDRRGVDTKKMALLVGFTYLDSNFLPGTYLDIKHAFQLLTAKKGFQASDIYVIYDMGEPGDFVHEGQQAAIARGFDGTPTSFWEKVHEMPIGQLGDGGFFVFWYSGHGSRMRTVQDPKELDGKDEWLVTPNHGHIMDNDFYDFLVTFPAGASVTAVVDACHAEGFSDLPFNYNAGGMREGFEVERAWCTDWARAADALPRARITYISGSQNEQRSVDEGIFGKGGVFTRYALKHWKKKTNPVKAKLGQFGALARATVAGRKDAWERGSYDSLFHRSKDILKQFREEKLEQEPNVCMWPTMTDSLDFDPFSPPPSPYGTPEYLVDYHPFVGGLRRGEWNMAVPPICQHGGRGSGAEGVTPEAKSSHHLDVVEGLKYAGVLYKQGDRWEGWEVEDMVLQLDASDPGGDVGHGIHLAPDSPDVVQYVHPGSPGARAGVRPGDIVRSVDGRPFSGPELMERLLRGGKLGIVGTRS